MPSVAMIFLPTFEINLSCQISLCLWRKNSDGSQDTKERTWVKCCSKVKCSMRQSSMLHPACKVFSRSPGTVQFRLRVLLCVFFLKLWSLFHHSSFESISQAYHGCEIHEQLESQLSCAKVLGRLKSGSQLQYIMCLQASMLQWQLRIGLLHWKGRQYRSRSSRSVMLSVWWFYAHICR